MYVVEDLRNGELSEIHATRLKFYADDALNSDAILPHVVSSETGMKIQRLLHLTEKAKIIYVLVRWRGLPSAEHTEEPIQNVYEDVPGLLLKLLSRKTTAPALTEKDRLELCLSSGEV